MFIYLYLAMSILVIIHSKAILVKTIQTTFSVFNQFCIIVSNVNQFSQNQFCQSQFCHNQFYPKWNQIHTTNSEKIAVE